MRFSRFFPGFIFLAIFAALLSNCDSIDRFPASLINTASVTMTPPPPATPTPEAILNKTISPISTPDTSGFMTVWFPPELNPNAASASGKLIAQRLLAFEKENPQIKIRIRIKTLSGPQGMLDTLAITQIAAPLAMPSIVILQQSDLESAVKQDLVYPVAASQSVKNGSDWYSYSQSMAQVNQKWYGIPFSGDALILLNRTDNNPPVIQNWNDLQQINQPLLFPASDPTALTTLALYQSLSGDIDHNNTMQPFNEESLVNVFQFYQHAAHQGLFPFSLSQYERFEQTWSAFSNRQSHLVVTWISNYLNNPEADYYPSPLPGLNGAPYTLATGEMFVLTEPNPERQVSVLKLMDFLVDSEFLASLNQASGNLPARISANSYPSDLKKQSLIDEVSRSAHLQPALSTYMPIANTLKDATVQVIRFQLSPQEAAKSVINGDQKKP